MHRKLRNADRYALNMNLVYALEMKMEIYALEMNFEAYYALEMRTIPLSIAQN